MSASSAAGAAASSTSSSSRALLLRTSLPPFSLIVGLTGGIGSGKSQARAYLASHRGAVAVDADSLGHRAYAPGGPAYEAVLAAFPSARADDGVSVDRVRLGQAVFGSGGGDAAGAAERRERLNGIVWPAVATLVREELAAGAAAKGAAAAAAGGGDGGASSSPPSSSSSPPAPLVGVVEAALLLEAGWGEWLDGVVLMSVGREEAIRRVRERNGLTEEQAAARVDAQPPPEVRAKLPGVVAVVDSSGPVEATRAKLDAVWEGLLARSGGVGAEMR
jgi:phosphopantetheine adenylyltransferase / dephospho-CoA kinase